MKIELVSSLLVIPFYWLCLCNHVFVVSGLCLDDQKSLLLQFKNNLTFIETADRSSSRLKSWNASNDCCRWMGVTCDKEGHVAALDLSGELISGGFDDSSSLFRLQHLQNLNLAANYFSSKIPSAFNKLENLTYLDLSDAGFVEQIPIEISQLTRLVTLNISYNSLKLENPNLRKLVQNLTRIRQLYLDDVSISVPGHEWCRALLSLLDLQELSMSHCNLSGPLDPSLARLENLSVIALYGNNLSSPVPETFAYFKNLTILLLSDCGLTGTFPHKVFNIGTLSVIDLSFNYNLHVCFPDIPSSGSLQILRLSDINITGAFPHFVANMRNLSQLGLSNCGFNGKIPNSLSNLTKLIYLDLSYNNFTGPVTSSHFEGLHNLFHIDLSYNSFSGSIPLSLFTLRSLQRIFLPHNQFSQLDEFINVTSSILEYLDISSNNLAGPFPTFPGFLRNLSTLIYVDLSNNQIQGIVPNWIWKLDNLRSLDISHNLLTHFEGALQNLTSNLLYLDLHYNKLQGPIPVFSKKGWYLDFSSNKFSSFTPRDIGNYLSQTEFLFLSNNTLHGSIPDSLCNASKLQVLDLSNNNISGTIPSCLMMMSDTLEVLNLKNNNFSGLIPDTVPASCALWTLNLHGNLLDGPIPKFLAHCSMLEVLDLGSNQIIGGFPCFLKEISTLRILVLRNNKFQGSLRCSESNKTWEMLQIVDIAFNNFSGKLPGKYFATWKRNIMHKEDEAEPQFIEKQFLLANHLHYQVSVTIISKGLRMELVKILRIFTYIDFSSNHFEGPIPEELMDFRELHTLNLSNNVLSREIPSSIGKLRQLESLDLSQNCLSGQIPMQLASLSFLAYLNLSFNHLVGKIPTGTQLQSFPTSSFEGNDGLYGPPLTKKLDGKELGVIPQPKCGKLACTIDWNFISVELGLVFGHGFVFGPLLIWKRWRVWYWQLIHKILCWIFPQMYLEYITQRGQMYAVLRWGY